MIALAARPVGGNVFLSQAFPFDVAGIAVLLQKAKADCVPLTPREISARLHEFAVARTPSGKVLGCAAVRPLDAERAELRGLVVQDGWRGAGVGRRLVEDAIDRAADRGLDLFCVSRSPRFFEGLGFERLGPEAVPPRRAGSPPGGKPRVALLHSRAAHAPTINVLPERSA